MAKWLNVVKYFASTQRVSSIKARWSRDIASFREIQSIFHRWNRSETGQRATHNTRKRISMSYDNSTPPCRISISVSAHCWVGVAIVFQFSRCQCITKIRLMRFMQPYMFQMEVVSSTLFNKVNIDHTNVLPGRYLNHTKQTFSVCITLHKIGAMKSLKRWNYAYQIHMHVSDKPLDRVCPCKEHKGNDLNPN